MAAGRYVPFALPGDRIEQCRLVASSPERVPAPCVHFGVCGGCVVQHWAEGPYRAWKAGLVRGALARAGFDPGPLPLAVTPPGARRRFDFAVRRAGGEVVLGLHRRGAREVVAIEECPVLVPALAGLLPGLRGVLAGLGGIRREASVVANLLDTGPDLLIRAEGEASAGDRARLAGFAREAGVPRVAWAVGAGPAETVAQHGPAEIGFGGRAVAVPPGAFLQASREGEAAILAAVLAGLPARGRVVELYAGVGTLSLPMAARGPVRAFEGEAASVAALRRAAAGLPLEAVCRDLVRQPLQAAEWRGVAAAVLDPPWAGAAAQMPALAAARVPIVVMVSCHPAALARDARALAGAGYRLVSAVAIDQFLWSARVEAVAVFEAPAQRRPTRA